MAFHLTEVEQGRAVFEGLPEFHHYNPIGTVHGGFAATLLDSALLFHDRKRRWMDHARAEVQPGASTDEGYRARARARSRRASRTHGRDVRRRSEGSRGKALCTRHHDVHDLPGKEMKIN